VTGNRIAFGALATTRMACEEPVMRAEATFLRKLAAATSFERSGLTLTLTGSAGTLKFLNDRPER
jgi:heat shock protein HslJ